MDLKQAVCAAKRELGALLAPEVARDVRLEGFLYDDHLMVWSLTIGFASTGDARSYKVVRVSEADKSVLSVLDR